MIEGAGTAIKAVLFDVGGPINTEIEHEKRVDALILDVVRRLGVSATPEGYAAAVEHAVHSYAPDAHLAIIWHLVGGDPALAAACMAAFRRTQREIPFELREGMVELVQELNARGLKLGLAANQPHETISVLDAHGIGEYFHHREVSGTHGYRKPDLRLFARCCEDLGVEPTDCIMVGDRIDNDIWPAKHIGMKTVLFRTGRHIEQRPRSHEDVPDAEVRGVAELRVALGELLRGGA
jgi:HAD superfamily hydrolase (TIGR01662 family)